MKKIFLILISIFLCLAVSDVGSVYARADLLGHARRVNKVRQ